MAVEINSKIVSYSVKKAVEEQAPLADENPLTVRIPSRPEGTLEAVSEKISYVGAEGRKKVYLLVSFMPVEGVLDGKRVVIERPVEFFFPSGQLSSEHQWITATMRSLSLAARGGYVTQAVADLRKVAWDKGLVRCGMNRWASRCSTTPRSPPSPGRSSRSSTAAASSTRTATRCRWKSWSAATLTA